MRYFKTIAVGVTLSACSGVSTIGGGEANGGAGALSGVVSGAGGGFSGATAGVGGTMLPGAGAAGRGSATSGAGGRAGSGPSGGPPPPDEQVVGCNYKTVLQQRCATVGCHNSNLPQANLVLVPDAGLIARLKDVPASFGDIQCSPPGEPYYACVPAECPAGALEVSSADWTSSWLLRKLDPTNCGDVMPDGSAPPDADELTCLQKLVQTIAEMP